MKQTYLFVVATLWVLLGLGNVANTFAAGRPFITKWEGKKGEALKIPIFGEYKLVIKNDKGSVVKLEESTKMEDLNAPYSFTPELDGVYTVEAGPEGVKFMRMVGNWNNGRWEFNCSNKQLLEVVQFGTVAWTSMSHTFSGCIQMTFAANIDVPDLSKVTNMEAMFSGCTSFNQPLNEWNVGKVTNMEAMFSSCSSFNQPLDKWDVSEVARMGGMFYNCTSFNQPLDKWNVSKVTGMWKMFQGCSSFNQPLDKWDVSKVTGMNEMFRDCTSFNQLLDKWDVSKVTDMESMFSGCTSFNKSLNEWKVGEVTDMAGMFRGCTSFNQPLDKWDVSKVTGMRDMFSGCTSFNQPLDRWDVSKVTSMGYMFAGCTSFNQPLSEWNVGEVTNMDHMFSDCRAFNQSLSKWNVSKVEDMERLFSNCVSLNQPMGNWTFSNEIRYTGGMFGGCKSFNQPLDGWKIRRGIGDLDETAMSPSNYSKTLVAWAAQADVAENVSFGENVRGLIYNDEGKVARAKLIDKGWSFSGDIYQGSGVAITPRYLNLVVGKEWTLPLEKWGVEASEQVTLESSKEGVLSWEMATDGKSVRITGLKDGQTNLTATIAAKDGGHEAYTSQCTVSVYTPVESITISPSRKTLKVGESFTLVATVLPENATNKELSWDAEGIAVNYAGGITAVRPGVYTITVRSRENGSLVVGTCEVKVVENEVEEEVTSLALSLAKVTLTVGETLVFQAKVTPASAAAKGVTWFSSDSEVASVENGTVTAKKPGKCTITLKSKVKGSTIEEKCEITVEAKSNNGGGGTPGGSGEGGGSWKPQTQAVEDVALGTLSVMPNPFTSQLRLANPAGVVARYELVNAAGDVLCAGTLEGNEVVVDTEGLSAGLYLVRFTGENHAERTLRVIKY